MASAAHPVHALPLLCTLVTFYYVGFWGFGIASRAIIDGSIARDSNVEHDTNIEKSTE